MRVSTVAICMLAAFAAQDLTHEANASPSSQISTTETEISNFVVEVKTIEPEQTEAVAPPETIATQQFTAAASEVEKSLREIMYGKKAAITYWEITTAPETMPLNSTTFVITNVQDNIKKIIGDLS